MKPDRSPGDGDLGDGDEEPPDYSVVPDDGIPLVESGYQERDVYCSAGVPVYYKFVGCISDEQHPIQIIGTPYANTGGARSVVLKRGSPPTVPNKGVRSQDLTLNVFYGTLLLLWQGL